MVAAIWASFISGPFSCPSASFKALALRASRLPCANTALAPNRAAALQEKAGPDPGSEAGETPGEVGRVQDRRAWRSQVIGPVCRPPRAERNRWRGWRR